MRRRWRKVVTLRGGGSVTLKVRGWNWMEADVRERDFVVGLFDALDAYEDDVQREAKAMLDSVQSVRYGSGEDVQDVHARWQEGEAMTPADVQALIGEMRAVGLVAGQCSVEGVSDLASSMAAAEAERCFGWADTLDAHVKALEALRDKWASYLAALGNVGRVSRGAMQQFVDELDVLLHGAGRLHDDEQKD